MDLCPYKNIKLNGIDELNDSIAVRFAEVAEFLNRFAGITL